MLGRKERSQLELFISGPLRQVIPDDHVETLPPAAHAYEFRPAVNWPPLVVPDGPLRSVIADPKAPDCNLPDAQRPDLAQVLFEDQPICGDFVGSDIFQACIEF